MMNCPLLEKSARFPIMLTAALLLLVLWVPVAHPEDSTPQTKEEMARQRLLKQEAAGALGRLKNSLEKDGFYSARIALNVWRDTAIEAGTFDPAEYDAFKSQLYKKSIDDSLRCFNEFMQQNDFYNAHICLEIWRMHSKEIGAYDEAQYEALKKSLIDARVSKASEKRTVEKRAVKEQDAESSAPAD